MTPHEQALLGYLAVFGPLAIYAIWMKSRIERLDREIEVDDATVRRNQPYPAE